MLIVFCLVVSLFFPVRLALAHHPADSIFFSAWHWRGDVLLILVFMGTIYTRGWLRLRRRNPRVVHPWQLALYILGLGTIGAALLSPVDALGSSLLSMHMAQHLPLLMIAPLSFLLANPFAAFLWGLPTKIRRKVGRLLARGSFLRQVLWALTLLPMTWSLYVTNLWVWHHPRLYQAALTNPWIHDLQHLLFFSTALFFWWPIVNPAPRLHGSIGYGFRIIYLIAATLQNTLLGMAISLPERVIYPFYAAAPRSGELSPLGDQGLGGGIMWISGHMYLIPIMVLVYRILMLEEEKVRKRPKVGLISTQR